MKHHKAGVRQWLFQQAMRGPLAAARASQLSAALSIDAAVTVLSALCFLRAQGAGRISRSSSGPRPSLGGRGLPRATRGADGHNSNSKGNDRASDAHAMARSLASESTRAAIALWSCCWTFMSMAAFAAAACARTAWGTKAGGALCATVVLLTSHLSCLLCAEVSLAGRHSPLPRAA